MKNIKTTIMFDNNRSDSYQCLIPLPSTCPHCGEKMMANMIFDYVHTENTQTDENISGVQLFQCTDPVCGQFFCIEYSLEWNEYDDVEFYGYLGTVIPYTYSPPINVNLPQNVEKVSSEFKKIYLEAATAENRGLKRIAGVGYRKAAEFLIKDYAITKNKDKESDIKSKMLMPVIKTYLKDFPKVQGLAEAVAWIGNDETHYERRHSDKDIDDLKRFILAAAQFIAADYDTDEALEFTSKDKS